MYIRQLGLYAYSVDLHTQFIHRHLSTSISISLYLSIYLYLYISLYIYIYISLYISLYIYIYTSQYLYFSVSIYLYIYLYIYISAQFPGRAHIPEGTFQSHRREMGFPRKWVHPNQNSNPIFAGLCQTSSVCSLQVEAMATIAEEDVELHHCPHCLLVSLKGNQVQEFNS